VVADGGPLTVRLIACKGKGVAAGRNHGLREARERFVLFLDDDMTVRADWVGVAADQLGEHPDAIITGRVLPPDGAGHVPSTTWGDSRWSTSGVPTPACSIRATWASALHWRRGSASSTRRIRPAASDGDFAYRWLRSGGIIRFVPELTTWHHDWRSEQGIREVYRQYAPRDGDLLRQTPAGRRLGHPALRGTGYRAWADGADAHPPSAGAR